MEKIRAESASTIGEAKREIPNLRRLLGDEGEHIPGRAGIASFAETTLDVSHCFLELVPVLHYRIGEHEIGPEKVCKSDIDRLIRPMRFARVREYVEPPQLD